jgi:chromate reductase
VIEVLEEAVRILGISGSLRRKSYNRFLLRAAVELAPPQMQIEVLELDGIPLYNADVEAQGDPEPVRDLKDRMEKADGLLIATPEYNHSVSGVLKNAIDWASRPPRLVLRGKPVAIMGATTGAWGTVRAQESLRTIFIYTQSPVVVAPEVLVARAREKFDAEGNLTDETTQKFVRQLLESLADWVRRLKAP